MPRDLNQFLDLVARRGLLPQTVLAKLHRQVAEKEQRGKTVRLEALADLLVEKGQLTRHQADSLLSEVRERQHAADSDIGLAPIEEPQSGVKRPPRDRASAAWAETKAATDDLSEAQLAALLKPMEPPPAPAAQGRRAAAEPTGPPADEALLSELPAEAAGAARPSLRGPRGAKNEWDSPLLLVGGGALLVLVLVGGLVWYLVQSDTGNAELLAARQSYENGAYAQAVEQYERFLESHAGHADASAARVELGLARIRRLLSSGASEEDVLAMSQKVIAEVEREPAFSEAVRELAAILPQIAEGLARKADEAASDEAASELIDKTEAALALVNNTKYVPKSFRPVERIADIEGVLASIRRRQERQKDLLAALAGIAAAVDKNDFQLAYRIHRELVEKHADAAEFGEVEAAAKSIASAEAAAIRFQEDRRPALTEDHADEAVQAIPLATSGHRSPSDVLDPQPAGQASTAFARIAGALFAVDAAGGEVLWRRYVGIAPHFTPLATPDGDVIVIDTEHGELVRLAGRTGQLLWRQPVGPVVANAALWSDAALVPTADARLCFIDLATGEARGFMQFAQPLATSAAIDAETNRIFIVGEHSSIYVIAAEGRHGEDVIFVGHTAGTVSVPAAPFGDSVCIVENFATDRSRLHVFSRTPASDTPQQQAWTSPTAPIRLTGRVTTPLAAAGRRLALATDLGELRVFDVARGGEGLSLAPVASRDATGKEAVDRHVLLHDSSLWLADTRLARLQVLATGGRLQNSQLAAAYAGDAFTQPLQIVGDRLFHVRRPQGQAGYVVAATHLETGEPLWAADVAAPPLDLSLQPGTGAIVVGMADGKVFVVDPAPLAAPLYKLGASPQPIELPSEPAARPSEFAGGLLVPLAIGQVLLVNPASGPAQDDPAPLVAPFQPRITPGQLPEWTAAEIVEADKSFAIADRRGIVWLVALQSGPPRFAAIAQSQPLATTIAGELCASSTSLFVTLADRRLIVMRLPGLEQASEIELEAQIVWGPFEAADCILFATADDRLHCLAVDGTRLAGTSLSAPAVGRPLAFQSDVVAVALGDGTLLGVDVAGRSVRTLVDLGEPLAVGPVAVGNRLVAATPDGTLITRPLEVPAQVAAATAQ